jgi:hypothetical protein
MSDDELLAKFRECASLVDPDPAVAATVAAEIERLDSVADVATIAILGISRRLDA